MSYSLSEINLNDNNAKSLDAQFIFASNPDGSSKIDGLQFDINGTQYSTKINKMVTEDDFVHLYTTNVPQEIDIILDNKDIKLNYCYFHIILKFTDMTFAIGEAIYGYNNENSYIELDKQLIVNRNSYTKLSEYFDTAFQQYEIINASKFLNQLKDLTKYKETVKKLDSLLLSAPLKKSEFEQSPLKGKYNCAIIRHSTEEPNLTDLLVQAILENQYSVYEWIKEEDLDQSRYLHYDFLVILTNKESTYYTHPNRKCLELGFYSAGTKLVKGLKCIQRKLDEKNIPDREQEYLEELEKQKELFKKTCNEGQSKEGGGCCGNKDNSGGCCGSSGGCGTGKEENEFFFDEVKEVEEEVKKEVKKCCGKNKKVTELTVEDITDQIEQVKVTSEVKGDSEKKKCCNEGSEGACCKAPEYETAPIKRPCCGKGSCKK